MRARNSARERAASASVTEAVGLWGRLIRFVWSGRSWDLWSRSCSRRLRFVRVTMTTVTSAMCTQTNEGTKECGTCRRWVSPDLHAVMPIGADAMCGLCLAMGELQDAIRRSSLTTDREEAVHQAIWRAHVLVVSVGRGTPSRPYASVTSDGQDETE